MALVKTLLLAALLSVSLTQQLNLLEEVTIPAPQMEMPEIEQMAKLRPAIPTLPPPLVPAPAPDCADYCGFNTITTVGKASVEGRPDTASITLELRASADTQNEAVSRLAQKLQQSLALLTENNLGSENWETLYINVFPNSSFVEGRRVEFGQIASQGIRINIPISDQGASVGRVYDSLAQISNVTINGFAYDLSDKTSLMKEARKNAYQNAEKKAKDYAGAGSLQLGAPLSIEDNYSEASAPPIQLERQAFALAADSAPAPTTVSVGTISVSYSVKAVFQYQ